MCETCLFITTLTEWGLCRTPTDRTNKNRAAVAGGRGGDARGCMLLHRGLCCSLLFRRPWWPGGRLPEPPWLLRARPRLLDLEWLVPFLGAPHLSPSPFLFNTVYFLEPFYFHSKKQREVQRIPICPHVPCVPAFPATNFLPQRGALSPQICGFL